MGPAGRGPQEPRGGQAVGEVPARAGRAGRPAAPGARGEAPGRAEVRLGCRAAEQGARGLGLGARSTRRAGPCLTYDLGQVARSLELERPGF